MTAAGPAAPGTAPGGGAQEAATPLALAAEIDKIARGFEADRQRCEADGDKHAASVYSAIAVTYRTDAQRIRERLAPAWDALAAERDRAQAAYDELVAEDHWLAGHIKGVLAQADASAGRYRRALEAIRDHNQLGRSVATAAQLAREALEATP